MDVRNDKLTHTHTHTHTHTRHTAMATASDAFSCARAASFSMSCTLVFQPNMRPNTFSPSAVSARKLCTSTALRSNQARREHKRKKGARLPLLDGRRVAASASCSMHRALQSHVSTRLFLLQVAATGLPRAAAALSAPRAAVCSRESPRASAADGGAHRQTRVMASGSGDP